MYEFEQAPTNELEQIEIEIESAKRLASNKKMLDGLRNNKEFKKLFLEMYLETESARLTSLLSAPGFQTEEAQADILNQLRAISHFGQFMATINAVGTQAAMAVEQHEATREDILAEDLN